MTLLNETHLQHQGSTDVITFDYSEVPCQRVVSSGLELENSPKLEASGLEFSQIHAEIFICIDEALLQAHRFRTT